MNEQWRSRITIEPGKRGGRPCIRGMRITVYDVLSYLAAGMTVAEVLDDFPYLTPEDIQACFAFAASASGACSRSRMKLLFDQNLSPKLVNHLADLFPASTHVQSVGLDCAAADQVKWEHALPEWVRHRDQGRGLQQPGSGKGVRDRFNTFRTLKEFLTLFPRPFSLRTGARSRPSRPEARALASEARCEMLDRHTKPL